MNERIKELAVQARQYAWANETHWSADAEREALFEQKFAELIVRECAEVASNQVMDVEGNDWGVRWAVKKHFGVAE